MRGDLALSLNRPGFCTARVRVWAVRNLSEVHLLLTRVPVYLPTRDLKFSRDRRAVKAPIETT